MDEIRPSSATNPTPQHRGPKSPLSPPGTPRIVERGHVANRRRITTTMMTTTMMTTTMMTTTMMTVMIGLLIAGCTGERPVLTPQQGPALASVDDPAVIAVADLLAASPTQFTANYTISPTSTNVDPVEATVARDGERQHIMIGDVDYYLTANPDDDVSCVENRTNCVSGINDAFISDLNITHEFWGPSSQRRLINDDARRIGPATGFAMTIDGANAECVELPLAGQTESGSVSYCATPGGFLGRYVGADVTIELNSVSDQVDPATLEPPPVS